MKKLFSIAAVVMFAMATNAQMKIDRTQQPKAGPAPQIKFDEPTVIKMPNGMTVIVVENHKLPKVTATLSIDGGPITEGKKAGAVSLMGSMLNEGTKTLSKDKFDERVDNIGADLTLSSGGGYVSALTRYFDQAFMLFADGLRNPAMKEDNFKKLQTQSIQGIKSSEKSASAISSRMVSALNYGLKSPMGEFETEESLKGLTLADIKSAYAKNISPSRSYLTFVGDITAAQAKALATKAFGTWKGAAIKLPVLPKSPLVAKTEVNFIDVPTAVQTELSVTNLVENAKTNPDIYALNIANQILGGGSDAKLFMNLREKRGFTYGSYSSVGSGRYQKMFRAYAQVRNEKADSALLAIFDELHNMQQGNITQEEIDLAKAKYNGSFALSMENPRTTATYANDILMYGLPKDYYKTYLQKINAVTKADIQRVANKYFSADRSRIVMVGKAADVVPGLKKAGYTVKMFDKFGAPVKEEEVKPMAANVTPESILAGYIQALGGEQAIRAIKSYSAEIEMEMQGMKINGITKSAYPGKRLMEMKFQGMTAMKEVSDGKTGYQSQMGQKKEMDADEIAEILEDESSLAPQMDYAKMGRKITLVGTEKVNGESAYKLKIVSAKGKETYEYYSTKSGLMLQTEKTMEAQGQKFPQIVQYSDYKKIGSVTVPTKITQILGGQEMPMSLSNIKFNEGVSDEDFK